MEAEEFQELFSKRSSFENVSVSKNEMSPRERFLSIMDFKKPDRIIDAEFGYWNDTLKNWHNEGLPEYIDNNNKADSYFGFDEWKKRVPANVLLAPSFEPEVISDDGEHKIIYDSSRVKCEIFSDGKDTIPHYLDYPVKDPKSYKPFKERLQPKLEQRIKMNVKELAGKVKNRNYILEASGGSTAGIIRNWMGFENICLNIYDQPELLDEILEDMSNTSALVAKELTKYLQIDLVIWWEDIAFKNGPIVTPEWFNKKCGKAYKKVMDVYRAAGTKYGYVDCDGDFRKLVPTWLNNGVNIMFPLEVAAGVHPVTLRKENPGIRMMGGVDKMILLGTKENIKKELLKLKPLVDEGGYIPHIDHRVQADVSYENYLYYLEVKRDLFNIPNRINE